MTIKQFDIIFIDLNPTRGREKQRVRPCLVVNNDLSIMGTHFAWVLPITNREVRYPTDIELKTKKNLVKGTIDTVQLRVLDLDARSHNKKDELQDNLRNEVLTAIKAQINP